MSLEIIIDAVARQAAAVPGIKGAYGTGAGGQGATVRQFPEDIADGPVAVAEYTGDTEVVHESLTRDRETHVIDLGLWIPIGNGTRGTAVYRLIPLWRALRTAFDGNTRLYGTVTEALITGSAAFGDEELNDKPYLVWRLSITAQEIVTVSHSTGS